MRSVKELCSDSISIEDMDHEECIRYAGYWFDKHEQAGFCETFSAGPRYDDGGIDRNGAQFKVLRRLDLSHDAEWLSEISDKEELLPVWEVEFEDGHTMEAYPENISRLTREPESEVFIKPDEYIEDQTELW